MTGPIDEAYVEIKPDLKNFDREVKTELDASFSRIEEKLDDLYDVIDKQFDRLVIVLDEHFGNLALIAKDTFDEIKDKGRGAGRAIAEDITIGTKIAKHEINSLERSADHDFNSIERHARGSGFSIGKMFSSIGSLFSTVASTIGSIGQQIGQVGSQVGDIGGKIGSAVSSIGSGIGTVAQIALWGVLLPTALGLAGALTQLAGALAALPAAAGVAVTAILPLILAFHGFAGAISAIMSGDPQKINEALKALSPSAAKVAKEFQNLVKPFSQIQKLAQESFFKPLVGVLTQLGNTVLPALRAGVGPVASAFGNMFAQIGKLFANAGTTNALNAAFATTARIINNMTPVIVRLVDALGGLFLNGLPFVERFFGVIGKGIDTFSSWLTKAAQGGKVTDWLDKAWHVGSLVWDVLKGVVQYLGTLLSSFSDEGTDTLNGMADALKRINAYLKTNEGQETLHNLGVIVHWAGNAFVFLIGSITGAWKALNAIFNFVRGIGPFFSNLGHIIADAGRAVGHFFAELWRNISSGVGSGISAVGNFFSTIGDGIKTAYDAVVSFGSSVIDWFASLPGRIASFVTSLPGMIAGFFAQLGNSILYGIGYLAGLIFRFWAVDFPNFVRQGWDAVVSFVSTSINTLVTFFTNLPGMIWNALSALGSAIGGAFSAAWDWAYKTTLANWAAIWGEIQALPGQIWGTLTRLGDAIGGWFSRAWDRAKNATIDGYHSVMNWINNLPGTIQSALSNAASWLYNAGKDAIRGLVNGLEDALSWAVDAAKNAASKIKQGFLDALHISSPSRVMDREVGRWILPGVVQGMKHSEPELISYLNSLTSQFTSFGGRGDVGIPSTRFGAGGYQQVTSNTPQVNVGGASVVAYVQIGDDQLQPAVVRTLHDNSQDVALAAQQGNTELDRRR